MTDVLTKDEQQLLKDLRIHSSVSEADIDGALAIIDRLCAAHDRLEADLAAMREFAQDCQFHESHCHINYASAYVFMDPSAQKCDCGFEEIFNAPHPGDGFRERVRREVLEEVKKRFLTVGPIRWRSAREVQFVINLMDGDEDNREFIEAAHKKAWDEYAEYEAKETDDE